MTPDKLDKAAQQLLKEGVISSHTLMGDKLTVVGGFVDDGILNSAFSRYEADQQAIESRNLEKATKKAALFLELKTRLAADLDITVASPADLAGRIEDVIPAARAKRNGKASTAERLAEMEKQVELLTMFVAILSRQ